MRAQTTLWIVGFCCLICCALVIALGKPKVGFCLFQEPNQLQIGNPYSSQDLQLDLTTGAVRSSSKTKIQRTWQFSNAKVRLTSGTTNASLGAWEDCEAAVIDDNGTETKFVLKLPSQPSNIEFLDSSTLVYVTDKMLCGIDLRTPSQIGSYPLTNDQLSITPIPNTKRIVVGPHYAPLTTDRDWLLDVTDVQDIHPIANWPAGIGTTVGKDCLYESNLAKSAIVRRSLVDGSNLGDLVLSREVQSKFDPKKGDTIDVVGTLIAVERAGAILYFDLESQHPIELGRTDLFPARGEFQKLPIRLFYGNAMLVENLVAYDVAQHRVVWEVRDTSAYTIYDVQAPDKLILGTNQFGVSVDILDARTGKVLQSFAPFRYLSWLMLLTEIGFAIWIVTWLRSGTSKCIPIWLSVTLLALIALTLFSSFHLGLDWSPVNWQCFLPQSYCFGIFLGSLTSSAAWLAFGRARIGTRYLAVIAVVVLLIVYARWMMPDYLYELRAMVSIVLLHAAAAFFAFIVLRMFNIRFESKYAVNSPVVPFTLQDLFVLAGVVAIMITTSLPIAVLSFPAMDFARWMALVAFAAGASCMLAVFSTNRILFSAVCALVAAIYAAMIFESLFQFVTARPLFVARNTLIWHWFRVSTAGLVTNFVVYFAYRNASFRLVARPWRKLPACESAPTRPQLSRG